MAVLYALSGLGIVEHEIKGAGQARVDVCFRRHHDTAPWFVGDVACVSDKSLEGRNPVQRLRDSLVRAVRKARLKPEHFGLWIDGGPWRERDGYRMKAYVPRGREQEEQAFDYLRAFAHLAATSPNEPRSGRVKFDDVDFSVGYSPQLHAVTSGGAVTDTPLSPKLNPLFTALRRKARQLKRAGLPGMQGIIVADGGSRTFGLTSSPDTTWATKTVAEFFRVHSSVDFVVILKVSRERTPERMLSFDSHDGPFFVEPLLFTNALMPDRLVSEMLAFWCHAAKVLPTPVLDPSNAMHSCLNNSSGYPRAITHLGGWVVTKNSIKISSTEVLMLLAGEITPEQFRERNRLYIDRSDTAATNPFTRALRQGRTISAVAVERAEDFDDDWLTFELSDPDPALVSLKV